MGKNEKNSILDELVVKAIENECDQLEIEYKDGYEQVTALKGNFGFGIADVESSSKEGEALRRELCELRRKGKKIIVGDFRYHFKVHTFESFMETAFRVKIKQMKSMGPASVKIKT